MKRILSLVCVLCLVFSLASAALAEEKLSGTIRYSTRGSVTEKEINEQIIAAFEEEYPGCTVELEYIPSDYVQSIDTMFLGGDAPDVIYGHPHYFAAWAKEGLLMDLTEFYAQNEDYFYDERFTTELYSRYIYKGQNIATVNGSDTFLLFYNKDMFDEAGVAYPTDNWTWDDFLAAAQALTNTDSDMKQYAMVMNQLQPIIYSFGGRYYDDMENPTQVVFNSPETIEALQFVYDCIYTYGVSPDTTDSELLGGSFATGRVAMCIDGAWGIANYANCDFDWDVAYIPLKNAEDEHITSAYYAGYAVNAFTENPELAMEFAKYFQSERAQMLLAGQGLITVIDENVATSDEVLKGENAPEHAYLRVETVANSVGGYANLTNLAEVQDKVLTPYFDQLILGSIQPADCAQQIHALMEELLPAGI